MFRDRRKESRRGRDCRGAAGRLAAAFALALLLLPPGLFAPGRASAREISPQRECSICHISWLEEFRREGVTPLIELPSGPVIIKGRIGVVSTERLCFTCHDGYVNDSRFAFNERKHRHPVFVKPSNKVRIPRLKDGTMIFPLSNKGELYCGTCHSAHGRSWEHMADKSKVIFLRESMENSAICVACHLDKSTGPEEGNHPFFVKPVDVKVPVERIRELGGRFGTGQSRVICQSCHRVKGAPEEKLLIVKNPNSELCGTCHADRYAHSRAEASRLGTHPVNVTSSMVDLPAKTRLLGSKLGEDGAIICQSCHQPHYSPTKSKILVRDNTGSALCMTCHDDKKPVALSKHNMAEMAPDSANVRGVKAGEGGPCSACHVPHGGRGQKMWARPLGPGEDPVEKLCLSCHRDKGLASKKTVGARSHPVGRDIERLGLDGEVGLPLFYANGVKTGRGDRGRVVCATCHDPHQWDPTDPERVSGRDDEGDGSTSFLRKRANASEGLCTECHRRKATVAGSKHDMGLVAADSKNVMGLTVSESGPCGACHVPHNGEGPRMWARRLRDGEDPLERLCRSCHAEDGPARKKLVGEFTHPVGRDIKELGVEVGLPLFDGEGRRSARRDSGNVTCATCHDPHRWNPEDPADRGGPDAEGDTATSFLRMKNLRSELCGACHADRYASDRAEAARMGTHPVNIKSEKIDVAARSGELGGRTGPEGEIICQSCHTPHNGVDKKILLGTRADSGLCKTCHGDKAPVEKSKHNLALTAPEAVNIRGEAVTEAGVCSACHRPHGGDGRRMWARRLDARQGGDRIGRLCLSCHDEKGVAPKKTIGPRSHPVAAGLEGLTDDVEALEARLAGAGMPLYDLDGEKAGSGDGGRVVCATCHDPHQWDPADPERLSGRDDEGDGSTSFLRRRASAGSGLCVTCHADKRLVRTTKHDLASAGDESANVLGETARSSGVCGACHVPHNGTGPRMWARRLGEGTDVFERMCRACHGEGAPAEKKLVGEISHPVGAEIGGLDLPLREDVPLFTDEEVAAGKHHATGRRCTACHAGGDGEGPVREAGVVVDPDLPLYTADGARAGAGPRGRVVCVTCHDPHRWNPGDPADRGGPDVEGDTATSFLRRDNSDSQLCGSCHIDRYVAGRVEAERLGTHPVNVTSRKVALPEKTRSFGGRVGSDGAIVCQSCHTPHRGADKKLLLLSKKDSQLCRACHDDKKPVVTSKHNMAVMAPESTNIRGETPAESGPCGACHLPHGGGGPRMWARSFAGGADPMEKLCVSCHNEEGLAKRKVIGRYSHPIGRNIKKLGISTDLPLYTGESLRSGWQDEGKVVCSTCHDPHRWDARDPTRVSGRDDEGDSSNSFLRKPADVRSELCVHCHRDKTEVLDTKHDMVVMAPESRNIWKERPARSGACGACHLPHNGAGPRMWARRLADGDDIVERMCLGCHSSGSIARRKTVGGNSHPTGRDIETLGVETDLPLFTASGARSERGDKGLVVCISCHNPHQWDPDDRDERGGPKIEGDGTNSFLRVEAAGESRLCARCHRDKTTVLDTKHDLRITARNATNAYGEPAGRSGVCGACHVPHNGKSVRLWARSEIDGGRDPISNLCLSCHREDGVALKKTVKEPSHPVGVPISNVDILARPGEWLSKFMYMLKGPLAELGVRPLPLYDDKGRKVVDGNVTCATCHNPHVWKGDDPSYKPPGDAAKAEGDGSTSFLRIANKPGSRLCRNCHVDKRPVALTKHNLENSAPEEKNVMGQTVDDAGMCGPCHVPHNGTGPRLWARELAGFEDTVKDMCFSCHSEDSVARSKTVGENSHPVGVEPPDAIRKATTLPLYTADARPVDTMEDGGRGGRVVCLTCHNPHQWDPDDINRQSGAWKESEGDGTTSFLRIKAAAIPRLCINCHEEKKYILATEHDLRVTARRAVNIKGETIKESGVCGQCHYVHNAETKRYMWARKLGPGEDMLERLCRSCHSDGRLAEHKLPLKLRHPKDVLMVSSDKIKKERGRAEVSFPVFSEDGSRAEAGFISCPTCHNPHRWSAVRKGFGPGRNTEGQATNSFLRSRSESALCTDCHGMDGLFRYKYFHGTISREKYPWR
ncbi:MAG TPA: hypothetical protein ENJ37_02385 [Deltaproteobacteria bacterium]|nr:hypothetical protein [Deltaproteobacteria bacterium]